MYNFQFFMPTKVLFGAGQLKNLHLERMPGRKALIATSNGSSTKKYGYLESVEKELDAAGVEHVNYQPLFIVVSAIMFIAVAAGMLVFMLLSWRYNVLLSGDASAKSMGVNVDMLRFVSMLMASVITAVCVSFLGVIGFVGIICPHVTKKLLGQDHRYSIPVSALSGSLLLLIADTLSRSMGNGSALPVGAITSLLGAPFFIAIIFSRKEHGQC